MTPAQQALSSLIKTKMDAKYPHGDANTKFCDALAEAITEFFEGTHTQVNVTSVSGVTTGPGVSGPGLGTITFIPPA